MIQVKNKIHDKFSLEFKVGFSGEKSDASDDFSINAWIFVPNNLNVNPTTYGKDQFYRDVKSNIRLITPDFSLSTLANSQNQPLQFLISASKRLSTTPNLYSLRNFEFQVKMFSAIFKSALRDQTNYILDSLDLTAISSSIFDFCTAIQTILRHYREIESMLPDNHSCHDYFQFGDEFMSHIVGVQSTKIIRKIDLQPNAIFSECRKLLVQLVQEELHYKSTRHYSHITQDDNQVNRNLISRHSLLKKYIESVLYLKVDKSPDGSAVQQITFGFAAGIAMIISTLIALPFQKYLGNYPFLIFIVLVVAYMFKDRFKELIRNRFAHRLKKKYFDMKSLLDFQGDQIGWIKEGMDFIRDTQTPPEVLRLRNRSALEKGNQFLEEKTILYRKFVHIDTAVLRKRNPYQFSGINDILRLHIQALTQKMDNPHLRVDSVDSNGSIQSIDVERIYTLHIILQCNHDNHTELHGFRISATRDGILECRPYRH